MIGQFGELTFFHKGKQTRTFTDFKSTIGLKTEEHPVVGWKGRLEVTGEELDEVTLHIVFSVELGLRPRQQYELLRTIMRERQAQYLIIGNRSVMDRRCIITNISSEWEEIHKGGEVGRIEVDVTFKEYQ